MQMHESASNGGGSPAGSYVHDLNLFLVQNAARRGAALECNAPWQRSIIALHARGLNARSSVNHLVQIQPLHQLCGYGRRTPITHATHTQNPYNICMWSDAGPNRDLTHEISSPSCRRRQWRANDFER